MKKKVYLVMMIYDNLEEYEDHEYTVSHLKIFHKKENAEAFIKTWAPYIDGEDVVVTDDISEINLLTDEDVEIDDYFLRHVFVQRGKCQRALYSFYIEIAEVE